MFGAIELMPLPPEKPLDSFYKALTGAYTVESRTEQLGDFELPVFSVGIPENADKKQLKRTVLYAAEYMKRAGIRRLAAPASFTWWDAFEKQGIKAIDRAPLYRESLWQTVEYAAKSLGIPIDKLSVRICAELADKLLYRFVEQAVRHTDDVVLDCRVGGDELISRFIKTAKLPKPPDILILFDDAAEPKDSCGAKLAILPCGGLLADTLRDTPAINDVCYHIPDIIRFKIKDDDTQSAVLCVMAVEGYMKNEFITVRALRWNGNVIM